MQRIGKLLQKKLATICRNFAESQQAKDLKDPDDFKYNTFW